MSKAIITLMFWGVVNIVFAQNQEDFNRISLFKELRVKSASSIVNGWGVNYKYQYPDTNTVVENYKTAFNVELRYHFNEDKRVDTTVEIQKYTYPDKQYRDTTIYQYFVNSDKQIQRIKQISLNGNLGGNDIWEDHYFYKNGLIDSIDNFRNTHETILKTVRSDELNFYGTQYLSYDTTNSIISKLDRSQPSTMYYYKNNHVIKIVHYGNGLCECPDTGLSEIRGAEFIEYFENGLPSKITFSDTETLSNTKHNSKKIKYTFYKN